jgi:hypothetical protein
LVFVFTQQVTAGTVARSTLSALIPPGSTSPITVAMSAGIGAVMVTSPDEQDSWVPVTVQGTEDWLQAARAGEMSAHKASEARAFFMSRDLSRERRGRQAA